MLSIEKDQSAEHIYLHGSAEDLREFAKKLWAIAEKAETKGKHSEQLTTQPQSDPQLSTTLQGEPKKHRVIKTVNICGRS